MSVIKSDLPLRTNRTSDLQNFLLAWDDPSHESNFFDATLNTTEFGNINSGGEATSYSGHTLSRWHYNFLSSIEKDIFELTLIVVKRFNWITYTSCEGHHYVGTSFNPVERQIGLIPRSRSEAEFMVSVLSILNAFTDQQFPDYPGYLEVQEHYLESEIGLHPVIDLFFRRNVNYSWDQYFSSLDRIYAAAVQKLKSMNSEADEE